MRPNLIFAAGMLAAGVGGAAADWAERSNDSGVTAARSPSSQTRDFRVAIDGVRSDSGTIMVGLYDSADGFTAAIEHSTEAGLLNDKGRRVGMAVRAVAGAENVVFADLPQGHYAVIVFHDENDNGRLDENAWGVPTEGYGFSNNAQGFLGAPSFAAAEVVLDGEDQSIAISLIYPKVLAGVDRSEESTESDDDK